MKAEGGLLSAEDLAGYHSPVGPAERRRFGDLEVFTCGAWCQGPVLLQTLALLEGTDVKALGHNSALTSVPSDRKSTRLNSSHRTISYAVFCLKKKKKQ